MHDDTLDFGPEAISEKNAANVFRKNILTPFQLRKKFSSSSSLNSNRNIFLLASEAFLSRPDSTGSFSIKGGSVRGHGVMDRASSSVTNSPGGSIPTTS